MLEYRLPAAVLAGGVAAVWLLTSVAPVSAADAKPKPFDISSPAVKDGGMLKQKNAGNNAQNKNCDGQNVSPPLRWSNAPANTKSYAIIMFDPGGRGGAGVVHWIAYDIPASRTSFKEGETSKPASDFKGGKSTPNMDVYFGPCPPYGDKPHPYIFTLVATDMAPGSLKAGMTRDEFVAAVNGHVLGSTNLITLYGH
ncbi:MAG TPA: YbhB/YbcL family Raf kinase inhibitor-like protein [Alphaproteobacteria bacterium]